MAFKNSGLLFGTLFLIMAALFSGIAAVQCFSRHQNEHMRIVMQNVWELFWAMLLIDFF